MGLSYIDLQHLMWDPVRTRSVHNTRVHVTIQCYEPLYGTLRRLGLGFIGFIGFRV